MHKEVNFVGLLFGASAFLVLAFTLFSDIFYTPLGGYADQRFVLVVILGLPIPAFFLAYMRYKFMNINIPLGVLCPSVMLSLAFLLLSLPFRQNLYIWVEPGMYALFFLSSIVSAVWIVSSAGGAEYAKLLALFVASICCLYGLASVNVYLFAILDGTTKVIDFIPWGFVNIRYWSHIATWCLPLIPLAALVGPFKGILIWRVVLMLGAGMWWWMLFITSGRGSVLGIVFGVFLVVLLFGRGVMPWLRFMLLYMLTGGVIWILLSIIIPSFMESGVQVRSIKEHSSGRLSLFAEAWQMSVQKFPLGMGPQSWLTHEPITDAYGQSKKFGHPHNMYLLWAAEYGWLLIVVMGGVVLQAVRNFWTRRAELLQSSDSGQLFLLASYTASVSAALFHAGVSAVFMAPGSMLVGFFVMIAFWALVLPVSIRAPKRTLDHSVTKSEGRKLITLSLATAMFLVLWFFWLGEVWQYYLGMSLDEPYYLKHESEGVLPRFWFHGNFPRN